LKLQTKLLKSSKHKTDLRKKISESPSGMQVAVQVDIQVLVNRPRLVRALFKPNGANFRKGKLATPGDEADSILDKELIWTVRKVGLKMD
jgi:hypothetical protein